MVENEKNNEQSQADKPGEADKPAGHETQVENKPEQPKQKSLPRRLVKLAIFLVYLLIIAEIGSRVYWKIKRDIPFFNSPNDWYSRFYDELKESDVLNADLRRDNGKFDVLLLGGSALDRVHYSQARESRVFQEALSKITGKEVRVFNLANPGLTTRDSLTKYRLLKDKHFDLVVVYHAINDTRLNNCPPEKFRDDYTHSGWYKQIDRMRAYQPMLTYFTLPYTIEYTIIHILSSKKIGVYLPRHRPLKSWIAHSTDIKTAWPFEANIQKILNISARRSQPILLLTFGWYIPENYNLLDCKAKKLDYADSPRPSAVELWGSIKGVKKGLAVHNNIIRKLADRNPRAMFVDVEMLIPKAGDNFNDVCHLSEKGKVLLMQSILPAIEAYLTKKPMSAGEK